MYKLLYLVSGPEYLLEKPQSKAKYIAGLIKKCSRSRRNFHNVQFHRVKMQLTDIEEGDGDQVGE
jgi:hypothetical protein